MTLGGVLLALILFLSEFRAAFRITQVQEVCWAAPRLMPIMHMHIIPTDASGRGWQDGDDDAAAQHDHAEPALSRYVRDAHHRHINHTPQHAALNLDLRDASGQRMTDATLARGGLHKMRIDRWGKTMGVEYVYPGYQVDYTKLAHDRQVRDGRAYVLCLWATHSNNNKSGAPPAS